MRGLKPKFAWAVGLVIASATAAGLAARAQQPDGRAAATGRFEFEIIESFDAQYLGDTPGHVGKNGGLHDRRPDAALGDPVYRGETKVGAISRLTWDRDKGSLEVEIDPEPLQRIGVGEVVWIRLDSSEKAPDAASR